MKLDSGEVVIIRPKKGWKLAPGEEMETIPRGEGTETGFWRRNERKKFGFGEKKIFRKYS